MRHLLCVWLVLGAGAATSMQQPRDAARPPAGTAAISGTVVSRADGTAIRGARVALTGDRLTDPILVTAGDDGAFKFDALAPGAYRLWAVRAGFLTAGFGEKRPGAGLPGTRIVLAAGERRERLRFPLSRGGVIAGSVVDPSGEPADGILVFPLRVAIRSGRMALLPTGFQETDDRGTYRFHELPPGEYVIAALSMGVGLSRTMAEDGGFRGAPGLAPHELFNPPDVLQGGSSTQTFHPQGGRFSDAGRITIGLGEERLGIDIRFAQETGVRVSGVLREMNGSPQAGEFPLIVTLSSPQEPDVRPMPEISGTRMAMARNGAFEFRNVPAGEDQLKVSRPSPDGRLEWAMQSLAVPGTDVGGLVLTLQSGLTISASLESDSGPPPAVRGLLFSPSSDSGASQFGRGREAKFVNGNFVADGLVPGQYRVSLEEGLPGWRLASAMFGDRDALDFLVDVKPGENPSGRVTLTKSTTEISGRVTGSLDPATNYSVVAFAADSRYWVPNNRRNVAIEMDAERRFVFQNLPAGRYRLAVVEDFDSVTGVHPALLRQLAQTTTVDVQLTDGARIVQDVRK